MPNKKIALVDIDKCLLLKDEQGNYFLNLALIQQLQALQKKGYDIRLFTQRNASLLVTMATLALKDKYRMIGDSLAALQEAVGQLNQPLDTLKAILDELHHTFHLKAVRVSTSLDPFMGQPSDYFDRILAPFQTVLLQAREAAIKKQIQSVEQTIRELEKLNRQDNALEIRQLESALYAICVLPDLQSYRVGDKTLQDMIDADRAAIITYLTTDSDNAKIETEKVRYLKMVVTEYIKKMPNRSAGSGLLSNFEFYTKQQWLEVAETIYLSGLPISGDLNDVLGESLQPGTDIYLPLDKNLQFAQIVQVELSQLHPLDKLEIIYFDDSMANHEDLQAYRSNNPDERIQFSGQYVAGATIIDYRHQLALQSLQPLDKTQRQNRAKSILLDLGSNDAAKHTAAQECLDYLGLSDYFMAEHGSRFKHLRAARTLVDQLSQQLPTEGDAHQKQKLMLARAVVEHDIANTTGLHSQSIEQPSVRLEVMTELTLTKTFTNPTYILCDNALYCIPNVTGLPKCLNVKQHLVSKDPAILARLKTSFTATVSSLSASQQTLMTEVTHHKPVMAPHIQTLTTAPVVKILATGCSGKEKSLFARQNIMPIKGKMKKNRGKVASGMEYISSKEADAATIVIGLGDHSYENPDVRRDILKPYHHLENMRVIDGNHEEKLETHLLGHTSASQAFALRDAHALSLRTEHAKQTEQPRVYMPASYYSETIKNPVTDQYRAFVIYLDSSLLPSDDDQQQWLQQVCADIDALDPDKKVPRVFAMHHSLLETTGKRGSSGKPEGGKYGNPDAQTGTQHQILFALMQRLGIPVEDYIVMAAHEHGTDVSVRNAGKVPNGQPLLTMVSGGGGSMSNQGDVRTFKEDLVFAAAPGFMFSELEIDSNHHVTANCYRCDTIPTTALGDDAVIANELEREFSLTVEYPQKKCTVAEVYFSDTLLQNRQTSLKFICDVIAKQDGYPLSWYVLAHHGDAIQKIQHELVLFGMADQAAYFDRLLQCQSSSAEVFTDDLAIFQQAITDCLKTLLWPIQNDTSPAVFLKQSPELFTTLQAFRAVLNERQRLLSLGYPDGAEVLILLRGTFTEAKPVVSEISETISQIERRDLDSDDEADPSDSPFDLTDRRTSLSISQLGNRQPLLSMETIGLSSHMQPAEPSPPSLANLALQDWRAGLRPLKPDLQLPVAERLTLALNDPILLSHALRSACNDYLDKWHRTHTGLLDGQVYVDHKVVSDALLPLVNTSEEDLALVYFLDHVAMSPDTYSLPEVVHVLLSQWNIRDALSEVRTKVLDFLLVELLLVLETWATLTLDQLAPTSDSLERLERILGLKADALESLEFTAHHAKAFVALLRDIGANTYVGETDRDVLTQKIEGLRQILHHYLRHAAKAYQSAAFNHFLIEKAPLALWQNPFWQQQFMQKRLEKMQGSPEHSAAKAQAIQFCHHVWQEHQVPTWLGGQKAGPFPLLHLANCVMQSVNLEHFRTLVGNSRQNQAALFDTIAQYFELFKATLIEQRAYLPGLQAAFIAPEFLKNNDVYEGELVQFYAEVWQEQQRYFPVDKPLFEMARQIMLHDCETLLKSTLRDLNLHEHPLVQHCCNDPGFFKTCKDLFEEAKAHGALKYLPEAVPFKRESQRDTIVVYKSWNIYPGDGFDAGLASIQSPMHQQQLPGALDLELGLPIERKSSEQI